MTRHLASIAPEALVILIGFASVVLAEAASAVESIPTAVSMGTVVIALLGLEHFRQKQGAVRETALMDRVAKLEDTAQEKLHGLIERQLQSAVKQDAMLLHMSDTLDKLIDGQKGMEAVIRRFSSERPCLLKDAPQTHNLRGNE